MKYRVKVVRWGNDNTVYIPQRRTLGCWISYTQQAHPDGPNLNITYDTLAEAVSHIEKDRNYKGTRKIKTSYHYL